MAPSTPPSPQPHAILILCASVDPAAVDEGALNDWWTNEHFPERLRLPGFQRARRYRALNPKHGQNEYLALYHVSHLRDLASAEYLHALNQPTQKTAHFMPSLAKMSRFACESVLFQDLSVLASDQPANVHDMLFMVVYQVDPESVDYDPLLAIREHITWAQNGTSAKMHVELAKVNREVTKIGSASKSYDGVQFNPSQDAEKTETVAADTFIALYQFRHSTTDSGDVVSTRLRDTSNLRGLHIRHTNTYELIASLDRSIIAIAH
jgi:hypothetical protein